MEELYLPLFVARGCCTEASVDDDTLPALSKTPAGFVGSLSSVNISLCLVSGVKAGPRTRVLRRELFVDQGSCIRFSPNSSIVILLLILYVCVYVMHLGFKHTTSHFSRTFHDHENIMTTDGLHYQLTIPNDTRNNFLIDKNPSKNSLHDRNYKRDVIKRVWSLISRENISQTVLSVYRAKGETMESYEYCVRFETTSRNEKQ